MTMKALVVGASGLLGSELAAALRRAGSNTREADVDQLDITNRAAVEAFLSFDPPDAIFNCAAYTAVDRAEEEAELAMAVNGLGPANLAGAARRLGILLVHFSTDFVFDGEKGSPYLPSDPPNPLNSYGRSKLEGEQAVQSLAGEYLLVRTSWLYGSGGANFVSAVLRQAAAGRPLRVVSDQVGRPTWSRNLAQITLDLVQSGARGVFHAADAGNTTWLGLATRALSLTGVKVPVEAVTTAQWGAIAARPRYSVLDTSSTERALSRGMEPWYDALARFIGDEMA